MNYEEISVIFKALCDKSRVEILTLLKNGEMCGSELVDNLSISQSTLSHHMKILTNSGIVKEEKKQKWSHYTIDKNMIQEAKDILDSFCGECND